jgi:hypothetical protein
MPNHEEERNEAVAQIPEMIVRSYLWFKTLEFAKLALRA